MHLGESLARSTRLAQLQHLLHKNQRGLTTKELSRLCGVCVRTIQRDMLTLHDLGIPLTQEGDRYSLLGGYTLPPVSFSLYEATALFLASRLALRQTDENNPHIVMALGKISETLPASLGQQIREVVKAIEAKPTRPQYIQVFEQVAIAWATQRRMQIGYQSLAKSKVKEWLVEPYFMDVTGVGHSTYVIGQAKSVDREGITTFKLDRIKEVNLLEENFEIPEGLSLESLTRSAWGVMWGEEIEVKLKFSAQVARRVKESVWHHSQQLEDLPDGTCLLTMKVGNTLEMTPWIRGWGPDVEVLFPASLRDEFAQYARRLKEIYGRPRRK